MIRHFFYKSSIIKKTFTKHTQQTIVEFDNNNRLLRVLVLLSRAYTHYRPKVGRLLLLGPTHPWPGVDSEIIYGPGENFIGDPWNNGDGPP